MTWGGCMQYRTFYETLDVTSLGGGVAALLPKGYTECAAALPGPDPSGGCDADGAGVEAEAQAIYARFTGLTSAPAPTEAQRYYARWLDCSTPFLKHIHENAVLCLTESHTSQYS